MFINELNKHYNRRYIYEFKWQNEHDYIFLIGIYCSSYFIFVSKVSTQDR